jgi:hypothetical protein
VIATVLRQQGHSNGSGAVLARALGIGHGGPDSTRRTRQDRFVINWGVTRYPEHWRQAAITFSNPCLAVSACVNKKDTIKTLQDEEDVVPCVFGTDCKLQAKRFIEDDGKVVVRTVLNGHSGAGIIICRDPNNIPDAPLYTRYFRKDAEYRVHVAYGNVILIQQKRRGEDHDNLVNDDRDRALIRTNDNGWVFCISDLDCDTRNYRGLISDLAIRAAAAVGINHGAVDILVKHRRAASDAVVCEINTAPALRNPSTLNAYVQVFRERI